MLTSAWKRRTHGDDRRAGLLPPRHFHAFDGLAVGDSRIDQRETAYTKVVELGPEAEPVLRDHRVQAVGDLRQRLDWALQVISDTPITDDNVRRLLLATRVLEVIDTPDAMDLGQKLTTKN